MFTPTPIDVNDRGHRLRSGSPVTNLPDASSQYYFLLSIKLEKWLPKSAIFHRCSVPSIDNRTRNSFDAMDIKNICDKMKTYTR